MAWTQADLDKLDAAIANSGAMQSMTFDGQTYQFRSIPEMLELRGLMAQQVSAAAGTPKNYRVAATSKGFR